jgi:phospholipid/cholesterol/gamma-HCH transport system substrate-binding protein
VEPKVNYTVVGLFVVILGSALILAAFMLLTKGRTKSYLPYVVYMQEPVAGLSEQSPVKYNGVDVGFVVNMKLNTYNLQQVRLLLNIEEHIPITETTTATLMMQGITGLTYVGLQAKTPYAPLLKAKPGQRYPVIASEPSLLIQLDEAVRDITHAFRSISKAFDRVFDEQNTAAIKKSLANIAKVTQVFSNNSQRIDDFIRNTSAASKQFPAAMGEIKSTFHEGKYAVENISQQTLPSISDLLERLKGIANNLEGLSSDLKANPSIIIRGQAPAALGPGER